MRYKLNLSCTDIFHHLISTGLKAILALVIMLLISSCAGSPEVIKIKPIAFPTPPDQPRFFYEKTIFGTGAVNVADKISRLKNLLTGANQRDGYSFAKPFDIAVHQGRVFISDTVHRVVFALDFVSGEAIIIGDSGDASDLYKPLGVATDNKGNLYVCDIQLKKLMLYDRNGKWRYAIDLSKEMDRPSGVEVSEDGSTLFVVDVGGVKSTRHSIAVYDTRTRSHLRTIGSRGKADGEFNLPRDVAIGPNDHLYVTDGGNFRIQILNQQGMTISSWGSAGRHLGQFTRPKGIATDSEGNIYVVDAAFGNFQIFTPEGELLLYLGERSETAGPAKYMLPAGIDVDEDGRVYVVDQFFRKVEIFRPAGLAEGEGFTGLANTNE
ncbi:MAG: hypothetical protein AB2652_15440 [Candidatus Thiodiazotropha endolucinida]|uniref:6-bladed beta-propeller n=1 Tax=Candidatus Thiodiazotropha taylori TaxID=2792791 RepID=A0A9E4TVL4_9GAMM|nr:6-bladed beta-propeller [Candidatus Thiodiazotropha taylori]MCW4239110.1 6-bladed beta-propeller [Candidatus Thiodiazotropha endolucinida]